jgi:23S rRNA pseudouridine1911/1915/1917 synthase
MDIPPPETPDLAPEDIPLDIVYDDEYLAVVNKPAGLVVHPAPGNPNHTLVNALLHRFGQLATDADKDRPGIVHRLDKDTSGLLVVAKNDSVARRLRKQLADREIKKVYHTVVCGHMPEDSGTIDLPIGRSLKDRKKMIVTNVKSRTAITKYRVLDRFRINDLVEVHLVTGRTHQIRVHLSHISRPVLGDPDYGGRRKWLRGIGLSERKTGQALLRIIDRQALHALSLEFIHPVTEKKISVAGDLPEDMKQLIVVLKTKYR